MNTNLAKKPDWLKVRIPQGRNYTRLRDIIHRSNLHTVCEEALCPNMGTCWENSRATLMILGNTCTRACKFCAVDSGRPKACDAEEPRRVAEAIKEMGLKDVVITSVTRDDLKDGGAGIWAETITCVHETVSGISVEVLIPDFRGSAEALKTVIDSKPEVLGHNLETVPSLYGKARPQADYKLSLEVLSRVNEHGMITKTGIMVGLGETSEQVLELMKDALEAGCEIIYIGQYLQPTKNHLPVHRYVEPAEFEIYRRKGIKMGFKVVMSSPLVRSSFHSEEQTRYVKTRNNAP